jgi:S-adenosylmethionine hydrolase
MADPIITLTTDFGEDSPYVAAMKGMLLGLNPVARLVDLSHQIPPQDVRHAAYFLAASLPYFPPGVVHLVVVDPGVGSERAVLCVELAGSYLVVPDNGCWTSLEKTTSRLPRVYRLTESRYWRQPVSATFHGRDILAPVAAHLSLGVAPASLGRETSEWVRLETPVPARTGGRVEGEVIFVDHFGNLITNIPEDMLGGPLDLVRHIQVGDRDVPWRVRTYADALPGTLVALLSSSGLLEIAVPHGNAAAELNAGTGTPVIVEI